MTAEARIAVVGAGTIGVSWAIVFARAAYAVTVHDNDPTRLGRARTELVTRLDDLARAGMLTEAPAAVAERVEWHSDVRDALASAAHVQECVPEDLALKREVLRSLTEAAEPDATIASSSSMLTASAIAGELPARERCLVAHPANPPHLLSIVELVPAPFTDAGVVDRVEALLAAAGMSPVRVRREVEGFIYNRLQGAVLREAYCLVRDEVASVDEVDRVVREGLGRRWAVVGPFETADLNARGGIEEHARRMGPAYMRMGAERGRHDAWTEALVRRVASERRALLPLDRWEERVAWRDRRLMAVQAALDERERGR